MFDRLKDMPAYRITEGEVAADRFNLVRRAILRLGTPLRIPLASLRSLEMVLDEDSWTVVDSALNDMPVVAWTHFGAAGRDNLHLPVACRTTQYHAHAGLIMETALNDAAEEIHRRIDPPRPGAGKSGGSG